MSDRLAVSSALSVLLMASYVLFGGDALQLGNGQQAVVSAQISAPAFLPQVQALLPR